ncbi:MAG: S49 family peptidase [Paracoccaceae bacterium]
MRLPFPSRRPRVSLVRLHGPIGPGPRQLSDAGVAPLLARAFAGKPRAVALSINSPGGSAVQSSLIGARIRRLSAEKGVPVLAFVEDVAASGGYWLASSADEVFVDEGSILGSIGVIAAGFGLSGLIERYGVERRVHTAGESKSMMDPFRPEKPEDVARLERLLGQIHQTFIAHVRDRRGAKLADDPELFTGEIWVGRAAVEVGLADHVGHMGAVLRERYGDKLRLRTFAKRRPLLPRLGMDAGAVLDGLGAAADERALWARYGL